MCWDIKVGRKPGMVAHTCKSSSGELEAGAQGQPRLHRHLDSQEQREKQEWVGEEEGEKELPSQQLANKRYFKIVYKRRERHLGWGRYKLLLTFPCPHHCYRDNWFLSSLPPRYFSGALK